LSSEAISSTMQKHEPMVLTAGPVRMLFCPQSGLVRDVRLGSVELLRGIYAAVRNENWGTVPTTLSKLTVERRLDGFRVSFLATCRQRPIDFRWKGVLIGEPDGTLSYAMIGLAHSTFRRNRIGFCVLHPIRECAGRPCTVEHTDDSVQRGEFPQLISPHQPFRDIRSITHEPAPGMSVTVSLEGDVFEMEDQRNWSDASYKTYCTPLSIPFPVEVREGTRIDQRVVMRLEQPGAVSTGPRQQSPRDEIIVSPGPAIRLPRLGLCTASHGTPLSAKEVARLRALRLDHLRVDVKLSDPDLAGALRRAAGEAASIGARLLVAVSSDPAMAELPRLWAAASELRVPVGAWLVFPEPRKAAPFGWPEQAKAALKSRWPDVPLGAGTLANFAELNRARLPEGSVEVLCFSVNPQVHAFDNRSLVETLEAQPQMVASARRFAGSARIAVSPITLKPRFNAVATVPEGPPPPGELPSQVDPRQCSPFAAAWTLGSIAQLAADDAEIATYYETTGWLGVMETAGGSPLPEKFPSIPGGVFPMYHVFADLAEAESREIRLLATGGTPAVQGLVVGTEHRATMLIANLTEERQEVRLAAEMPRCGQGWRLRMLDAASLAQAMARPEEFRQRQGEPAAADRITLPPHSYARLETSREGAAV
jgi:hypothetical protein